MGTEKSIQMSHTHQLGHNRTTSISPNSYHQLRIPSSNTDSNGHQFTQTLPSIIDSAGHHLTLRIPHAAQQVDLYHFSIPLSILSSCATFCFDLTDVKNLSQV